jgi:hypothetical protein
MTSNILPLRCSVVRAALFILTAATSISPALSAQSRTVATADIPFAFSSGAKVLPAGHYTFVMLTEHTYALKQEDGQTAQLISVLAGSSPKNVAVSTIRFHQYGDSYFLEGAWFASAQTAIELQKGKAEKELQAATKMSNPTGIALAMNTNGDRK